MIPDLPGRWHIRPMEESDLDLVHEIDSLSFSMPWPVSSFHFELNENPNSLLWVAELDDTGLRQGHAIIGFIVVWLILDEAHIASIAVHPDFRQQGVARQLLITALEACMQRRISQATLEVRAGNLAAQNLYNRFNFKLAGVRPRYYKDNQEDAWIMTASAQDIAAALWLESKGQPACEPLTARTIAAQEQLAAQGQAAQVQPKEAA